MPVWLGALLCGLVGAISAHLGYARSNLFILGEATRRGRHLLWDPLFFDGLGLIWGLVAGSLCALWLSATSPAKAVFAGLGLTLAGIAIVSTGTTWQRWRELPRDAEITGPRVELEFELQRPAGAATPMPLRAVMNPADRNAVEARLQPQSPSVLTGRVPLRQATSPRLISVDLGQDQWLNFMLPLAAVPTTADEAWTDWAAAANADPTRAMQLRYRVRFDAAR